MIFLSIIITLVLDRLFNRFHSFRQFKWLQSYMDWMDDVLSMTLLPAWVGFVILMLPLLFAVSFFEGIFAHGLWGLFDLAFSVVVLFLCLGPLDTDQQVDDYLHAIDTGDQKNRLDIASAMHGKTAEMTLSTQATQVVDAVFTLSHRRLYACLFWFVVLGPIGAVFYRLVEQSRLLKLHDKANNVIGSKAKELTAYLEWLPARLSMGAFMVAGHFEGAFKGYRKAAKEGIEMDETNQNILVLGGRGAIQFSQVDNEKQASEYVIKARGLILRSLVVWLLFCLMITLV